MVESLLGYGVLEPSVNAVPAVKPELFRDDIPSRAMAGCLRRFMDCIEADFVTLAGGFDYG